MMLLAGTTDSFELVTSTGAAIDVTGSYVDIVDTTGVFSAGAPIFASIASATTTANLVAAPGSGKLRNVKQIQIRNKDAALACDVTWRFNRSATTYEVHKVTLQPGEMLEFIEGLGWLPLKQSLLDTRQLTNLEPDDSQRIFSSRLVEGGTFLTISGTAYYVYMGRTAQDITPKFVEFHVTTAGAGTDTKEVGLFSTPSPPNKSAQTLTKIFATGTVDSGTTTGVKRNTSANTTLVPKGTHLWAAYRGALATTQITAFGLLGDMSQGHILTTTGGGALTGVTTAAGTIPTLATATNCPALRVTMD